jgi:MraZ protein
VAAFFGTYTNKVDKKGRVSVPARFRAAIAGSAYQGVLLAPNEELGAIDGSDFERLNQVIEGLDDPDLYDDEARVQAHETLAMVQEFPVDGDGRMVLSQEFRDFAGITEEAVFTGIGSNFHIWSPGRREAHRADSSRTGSSLANMRVPKRTDG